ncbi:hypothetical protein AMTR_s00026p00146790 [Amborella trichopoda]|uniref:Aberrant root formation protein 4 n=2 Tax=Amborella trichopoda TaxID=13333 RepID=W1PRQ1_AMBTC|nr:hypothetical protein AMTR_s00026p00146790 [Amborella trichopoda]
MPFALGGTSIIYRNLETSSAQMREIEPRASKQEESSMEDPEASSSDTAPPNFDEEVVARLEEAASLCSKALVSYDSLQCEKAIDVFVNLLEGVSEAAIANPENLSLKDRAYECLDFTYRILSPPYSNQILVDALSLELPKAVAKFAGISEKCLEVAEHITDYLCMACNPRDMLSILCEALDSLNKECNEPAFFLPLFCGISRVFCCIQRRHLEQIKRALPAIFSVLESATSKLGDEVKYSLEDLMQRTMSIVFSVQEVCKNSEGWNKEQLTALLGACVLELMAIICRVSVADEFSRVFPFVSQLSEIISSCRLSYLGLLTGSEFDAIANLTLNEDEDFMKCFSHVRLGASLAVIWGYIYDEVAKAAGEDFGSVRNRIQICQSERWKALCIFRDLLSSLLYSFKLKSHAIDFILSILEGNFPKKCYDQSAELSSSMTSLFALLQAVQIVMVYAPDPVLRKKAFTALKWVLRELPPNQRFDMFKALFTNSEYPSMTALLLDLVREEVLDEATSMNREKYSTQNNESIKGDEDSVQCSPFCSQDVLELVELVLRPPKGGPPELPEQCDAISSALNLYRFLVMLETSGKANYKGVISRSNLQKAYTEWLLPLRTLVSGTLAENEKDRSDIAISISCSINPVEFLLYHCLELVEDCLKHSRA